MSRVLSSDLEWLQVINVPTAITHQFADVTLLSSDSTRFYAHSSVLSLSPVLEKCLALVDVRVSRNTTINIQFHSSVVSALLNFLYTGCAKFESGLRDDFRSLCRSLRLNPSVCEKTELKNEEGKELTTDNAAESIDTINDAPETNKTLHLIPSTSSSQSDTSICKHDPQINFEPACDSDSLPGDRLENKNIEDTHMANDFDLVEHNHQVSSSKKNIFDETSSNSMQNTESSGTSTKEVSKTVKSSDGKSDQNQICSESASPVTTVPDPEVSLDNASSTNASANSSAPTKVANRLSNFFSRINQESPDAASSKTSPEPPAKFKQLSRPDPFQNIRSGLLDLAAASRKADTTAKTSAPSPSDSGGSQRSLTPPQKSPDIPLICDICFKIYIGEEALSKHKLTEHDIGCGASGDCSNEEIDSVNVSDQVDEVGNGAPGNDEGGEVHAVDSAMNPDTSTPTHDRVDGYDQSNENEKNTDCDEETPEKIFDYLSQLNKERRKQRRNPAKQPSKSSRTRKSISLPADDVSASSVSVSNPSAEDMSAISASAEDVDMSNDDAFPESAMLPLPPPPPTETGGFKEFKMPENFDIPQDYIQEIVPKVHRDVSSSPLSLREVSPPLDLRESSPGRDLLEEDDEQKRLETSSPEHITYYAKDNSSRLSKGTRRHPSDDAKWNRRKKSYVSVLFGDDNSQDSDPCTVTPEPGVIPSSRKEFETCGGTTTMLSGENRQESMKAVEEEVTPDSDLMVQLEDKKERIKRRLLEPDSEDEIPQTFKEKRKKKKKKSHSSSVERHQSSSRSTPTPPSTSKTTPTPPPSSSKSSSSGSNIASKSSSGLSSQASKPSKLQTGQPKNVQKYNRSEGKGKSVYKFEDDFQWLVNDSFEESDDSAERRRRKEKKRKKKKRMKERQQEEDQGGKDGEEEDLEEDSSDEDDRRKRLDARKKRKGGDVLAWMSRRPKVSVKYWEDGRETIIEKSIYKMNLLGADDETSEESGDGEARAQQKKRVRKTSTSSLETSKVHRTPSPVKKKKHKKKRRKKDKSDRRSPSSESSSRDGDNRSSAASWTTGSGAADRLLHGGDPRVPAELRNKSKDHSMSLFARHLAVGGKNDSTLSSTHSRVQQPWPARRDNDDADKKAALFKRSVSLHDESRKSGPPSAVLFNSAHPTHHHHGTASTQQPAFQRSLSSMGSFKIPKLSSSNQPSSASTGD